MMSNALVPSDGSSASFAQQGSVDWVALSGSTFTFSVEVLSRFAKAGVEMITVAMGQAIFSKFKLRHDGQRRFSEAIAKLKTISSYGELLWFGFGIKHVVKILSETEQGTTCAAMCACLSVSYDPLFSSRVLQALTDQQAAPDTLTPSLSQWSSLLNVCAGAVSNSIFAKHVEGMSRLLAFSTTSRSIFLNEPTSPDALAIALLELGKVSRGDVRSVTLLGGVDCGWLAAVSQWLLSLSVDILDESGVLIYSHRSLYCPSYPLVIIIRSIDSSREVFATTVTQRSFFVPPGKLCFGIMIGLGDRPAQQVFSTGRSEWTSILHDAFGVSMDVLLAPGNVKAFAHFIYSAFSVAGDENGTNNLDPWSDLSATHRQRQISHVSFASKRLPELATLLTVGESNAYDAAFGVTDKNLFPGDLAQICPCRRCNQSSNMFIRWQVTSRDTVTCLHLLAITIFQYIWILSWLDIDEAVYPSAGGLRDLYLKLYQEDNNREKTPFGIKEKFFYQPVASSVIPLFTGLGDAGFTSTNSESARCTGGVCVYLNSLKNPTTRPQDQLRVNVVLGQIERRGSTFEVVLDKKVPKFDDKFDELSPFLQAYEPDLEFMLIVDETLASSVLEAYLFVPTHPLNQNLNTGLVNHPGFGDEVRRIGPADIRQKIVLRSLSPRCLSQHASMNSFSVHSNDIAPWAGLCFLAKDHLWNDVSKNVQLCPTSNEWILMVRAFGNDAQYKEEVLRGSYALFYAIICHTLAGMSIRLTSTSCLLCCIECYHRDSGPGTANLKLKSVVVFSSKNSAFSTTVLINNEALRGALPRTQLSAFHMGTNQR